VHGPTDPVLRKCVNLAERILEGSGAIIAVKDSESRRIIIHSLGSVASLRLVNRHIIHAGSLTERVCYENSVIASTIGNEARWSPAMPEISGFHAKDFIAAPIHDPANEPIGMLACFSMREKQWREADVEAIENLAILVTQRIMLKAALKTVTLMSNDMHGAGSIREIAPVRPH